MTPARHHEPRWPAAVALLAAIGLYVLLPSTLIVGPRWLLPVLEGLLVIPLLVTNPDRRERDTTGLRLVSILLIAIITIANISALGLLVHDLLRHADIDGKELVYSAIALWFNNVIVFALWYWEADRGGPGRRAEGTGPAAPDFLFPQMSDPSVASEGWRPYFFDYLYLSFSNAASFAAADALPMSRWAKAAMLSQSALSLSLLLLVLSRVAGLLS